MWAHLEGLAPGQTRVIVSQKVSSVRDADRIVLLDAGRIVEEGTHDELIVRGGLYAATYRRQTESLVYGPGAAGPTNRTW